VLEINNAFSPALLTSGQKKRLSKETQQGAFAGGRAEAGAADEEPEEQAKGVRGARR
jgi:hypothetical protein